MLLTLGESMDMYGIQRPLTLVHKYSALLVLLRSWSVHPHDLMPLVSYST